MKNTIYSINGPVVTIKGKTDLEMMEMVYVGKARLVGEVIRMNDKETTIQVYEETSGIGPGAEVVTTGAPLSVELGPGLLENIYDGIQRPLEEIMKVSGATIARGIQVPALNREKKWDFVPTAKVGDTVTGGDIIGTVQETSSTVHKIMVPHGVTGTIADNIRYGRLDATDEEVRAAAKLANADSFIRHLPQGYDTVITGDGGSLSQGERQLLAIARAAVSDPPVLILDEATSSIDTRTENLIEQGMDSLMEGRTVFVIAHRLSTVRNSQAILVLEHGRIIERGDHQELLAQKGKYYQLYTGKAELS